MSLQPSFKDYPVYLTKFKQCLSKAMHLMKSHTVNTLQNLTAQLAKRVCFTNVKLCICLCSVFYSCVKHHLNRTRWALQT